MRWIYAEVRTIVFESQLLRLTSLPTRESAFGARPICRGGLLYVTAYMLAGESGQLERSCQLRRSRQLRGTCLALRISHFINTSLQRGAWARSTTATALVVFLCSDEKPLKRLGLPQGVINTQLKQGVNERIGRR